MTWIQTFAAVAVATVLGAVGILGQERPDAGRLTIEQLVEIKHPSNAVWSPDGNRVVFVWDQGGVANVYVVGADGRERPRALTEFAEGGISADPFWSADGQMVYFARGNDLWAARSNGGKAAPLWGTAAGASEYVVSPERRRVAFARQAGGGGESKGSDLVIRGLSDGSETVAAHDEVSIGGIVWSPDGAKLAYIGGAKVILHDESPAYSGAKLIFRIFEETAGQAFVVGAKGGKPVAVGTPGDDGGLAWVDGKRLVFDRQSRDFKKYSIYTADAESGVAKEIHRVGEEKFWSIPDWGEAGAQPWPSPDGKWIAFLSDEDGWDHIYVMGSSGGEAVQITKGRFEAWRPAWSHDGTRIAFDANEEGHPGDRRIGIARMNGDPERATVSYATAGNGTNIAPHWSADDRRLLYQHTDTRNSADLCTIEARADANATRVTDSMPAGINKAEFVEPQFVKFPGADGEMVPGWLFVPKNLDRTKKHPAIVWIHGDGVNQNYNGWHVERNYAVYYSFHQYLLQKGYVVFAPDYRGSIGYGRDWRTAVHMDVGGRDAKDAWMAGNYLKTLPYVDGDRMGVWGLSYGGFFTLIAMTDQPRLFRAGVDVAGVVDYKMYYGDPYHGDWTESRIGTPEQNPEVYAKASPISHIDRLERPLLVLHGTADVNVPFLESVWLVDEALKKGKGELLRLMIYPGEFHYFTRTHVLLDAWHRVESFFDLHLGSPGS